MNPNDPRLKSFISYDAEHHFSIQNLPYGVFHKGDDPQRTPTIGVAIGDWVLDCKTLENKGLLKFSEPFFQDGSLNSFMARPKKQTTEARQQISELLRDDCPTLRDHEKLRAECLVPQSEVTMHLAAQIGDYTDFYSSKEHATNVGSMFRDKDNPLLPNWTHLPVGYHGRASSVVVSGQEIYRPMGQTKPSTDRPPQYGPCQRLDFELELAFFVGQGSQLGQPIPIDQTPESIFGFVLMNDWSARDIQKWEYVPLGPFVSKSFATSVSPWVVPLEALEPFRVKGPQQDPQPLDYLTPKTPGASHWNMELQVNLKAAEENSPQTICRTNARYLYWSAHQQLAHHTITGCNVKSGDLMASGTISGQEPNTWGSLLELTTGGKNPLELTGGGHRTFLEDGDQVTMTGWCQGDGYRVGLGEVSGTILAPLTSHQ